MTWAAAREAAEGPDETTAVRHLFLSPHIDDAVASCGGTIAMLTAGGEEVTVFNIFCGDAEPPYSAFADELHSQWGLPSGVARARRAEEEEASRRLRTRVHFEGVADAIYRRDGAGRWLYRTEEALRGPRHADDEQLVAHLAGRVGSHLSDGGARLYAPLGIGTHVDHLLAFDAGLALRARGHEVVFYEDFPYAADEAERRARLDSLPGWTCEVTTFDGDFLEAKIEAFGCYGSQVPMLFDGDAEMSAAVRGFARLVCGEPGRGGERYWRPSSL